MKAFKLFLTGLMMSVAVGTAVAQEPINIIMSLPPGGFSERANLAFKDELEKNGYKTNVVRFDNCKGLENWIKANPTKPAVFDYILGNQALAMIDPGHPGGCTVTLTEKTVLVTSFQTQFQACSLASAGDAKHLWMSGRGKMGITASPDINGPLAEKIVADVNKNIQVIKYKGNPALVQALISREVDFVGQFSNAAPIIQAGGNCFFTTADRAKAAKNKQLSIDDFRKNSPMAGIGYLSVAVGLNVDTDKVRPIIADAVNKNPAFAQHFANGADKRGVPAGATPAQQFKLVEDYLNHFKK